jgi:uncharacterized protein YabN with tetrapyrrole methylase and pyrophosphatase domain
MSKNDYKEEINPKAMKITNIDHLEKEIMRLKLRIKTLENDWESNNKNLKENLGDVLLRTLYNKILQTNQAWFNIAQMIINQPTIKELFSRFRERIIEKLKKIFRKKENL